MRVAGQARRTIQLASDGWSVEIIDQTLLPHELVLRRLASLADAAEAIRGMRVRGAPLIGVTAAFGLCLALREDASDAALEGACAALLSTRPTAVNLRWALGEMRRALAGAPPAARVALAYARAAALCEEDVATCRAIGEHGFELLRRAAERKGNGRLEILTHCNAGWLAAVDWGTALAPVYLAGERRLPVHVWVAETRPRNQGASLTAWELGQEEIPHTVVADSAGGHLMQTGRVDLCLTGSDRTTAGGDVCNKIGTYPKALAARDNGVPFYVALPSSSIDWGLRGGPQGIPIEERDGRELRFVRGRAADGRVVEVEILPPGSPVANCAFDVTPARLVTALVTERGSCEASAAGLARLFPERAGGGAA
jgi:methylthioribose-1-phosphate isomerase